MVPLVNCYGSFVSNLKIYRSKECIQIGTYYHDFTQAHKVCLCAGLNKQVRN